MPDERRYFVICEDNCKFESMTKEQIIAAIAEATGETPTDIDAAFITKVKEQNHENSLTFWQGTTAEYNAIETKSPTCFYIITDDRSKEEMTAAILTIGERVDECEAEIEQNRSKVLWSGGKGAGQTVTLDDAADKYNVFAFVLTESYLMAINNDCAGSKIVYTYKTTTDDDDIRNVVLANMDTISKGSSAYVTADNFTLKGSFNLTNKTFTITEAKMDKDTSGTKSTVNAYVRKIIGIA